MRTHRFLSAIIFLTALLLSAHHPKASANSCKIFRSYTTANGLPDNTVNCGIRDSYGFLWFGTSNGLCCFDGVSTMVYRDFSSDNSLFSPNNVTALLEYDHDIFVGGMIGINVFNRDTNHLTRFLARTKYGVVISTHVTKMAKTRNGLIWICTLGQGFFIYNPATKILIQNSRHGGFVSDVVQTADGTVYVSTISGNLNAFSENGRFIASHTISNYINDKSSICMRAVGNDIWIGTDKGLHRFNCRTAAFSHFPLFQTQCTINAINTNRNDALLLATNQGIYVFCINTHKAERIDGPDHIVGLTDKAINDVFFDKDGTLWVMTEISGVCYLPEYRPFAPFINIPGVKHDEKSLVQAFCHTGGSKVYVGTTTGLYIYDTSTQTVTPCEALSRYNVTALMLDGHQLWVGTWRYGVKVLNLKTGEIRSYTYSENVPYTVTSNKIRHIFKSKRGIIYVSTNWGLSRYDSRTEHFFPLRLLNSMSDFVNITEDRHGLLWAATNSRGLYRYRISADEWLNYTCDRRNTHTISDNSLTGVFYDSRNRLWCSTRGGGLCLYDEKNDNFVRIRGIEGQVYFVCEDSKHNIWVSTDIGLIKMPDGNENDLVHMVNSNELWQGPLNKSATLLLPDGRMLFGSENGFYCMRPETLPVDRQQTPVYVTSISLPYAADSEDELERIGLNRLLYVSQRIKLPFSDNSFTLHFASPRFNTMRDVRFEYILRGFDKQWVRGTDNREATYSNVPPGTYQFLLREAGSEDNVSVLEIEVLPPWYRTNIAYIIYIILIFLIWNVTMILSARRAKRALQDRYNEQLREQEKKTFESKIRFFVNLVHEIRTPLNLISLPLERMEETKRNDTDRKYMTIIRRNMNYLLGITNQLLDFQKTESGSKKMEKKNTSMHFLLHEVCNYYESYGEMERKHVELKLPDYDITTAIDIDCMQKILMNLMSNALKYARSRIVVTMKRDGEDSVKISVIDDGPGISDDEKKKIFTSFYQVGGDRIAKILGTGLGLAYANTLATAHGASLGVEDAPDGGSCFTITMPIELVEEEENAEKEKPQSITDDSKEADDDGSATRQFNVLVVEDNTELLNLTCDALHEWYHIYRATNGLEALNVLAGESIDVIVSDVMMPVMDGIELCRRVKGDIIYSHIPLILLTAKTTLEAKVEGMESGADVYLEKPFSIQQLHLQIKNLLRMRQNFHKRMSSLNSDLEKVQPSEFGLTRQNLQFVEHVQQILIDNMSDESFSIDSMAGMMNMSRSSFYRKLKSLTGQSPVDFLKSQRITRGAALLLEGFSVTEVAVKVGFSSSSYFTKCFKQQFEMLPKEYVKEHTQK